MKKGFIATGILQSAIWQDREKKRKKNPFFFVPSSQSILAVSFFFSYPPPSALLRIYVYTVYTMFYDVRLNVIVNRGTR